MEAEFGQNFRIGQNAFALYVSKSARFSFYTIHIEGSQSRRGLAEVDEIALVSEGARVVAPPSGLISHAQPSGANAWRGASLKIRSGGYTVDYNHFIS